MTNFGLMFEKRGKIFLEASNDMPDILKSRKNIQENIPEIVKLLKKTNVNKILDLGCGSGRHTVFLSKNGFEVYSLDILEEELKLTKAWLNDENSNAKIIKASCYERLPFADDFFDVIISTQVIHHNFHDKIKDCISEIERILKPRGIIFITVPSNKDVALEKEKFKVVEYRTYIPLHGNEKNIPHFIYSKSLLKDDFNNFKILSLHKDSDDYLCLLGIKQTC